MILALALTLGLTLAALPEEALPTDPVELAVWQVEHGAGHLRIAARTGSSLLLQEAEREIVEGLLAGLGAATASGVLERSRYQRMREAYEHAQGVFKDLPYQLVVEPGEGLTGFVLPLRRHPWLTLLDEAPVGWRAERIESGVRLTPAQ